MIDTHAHLDQLKDIDDALLTAKKEGVEEIVAVSIDVESSKKNLEISLKENDNYPKVHLAFGVHPSEANVEKIDDCIELIREHSSDLKAIGEIGLDFWYKWVKKDQQKKDEQIQVYSKLLELAKELDLPAVIHSRGAWKQCFEIAKEINLKKVLFHWYSGPIDILEDILDSSFYISVTPSLGYSPQAQDAAKHAPMTRILIETDTPVFYRNLNSADKEDGYSSEPKDVFKTLDLLSKIKDIDPQQASVIVNKNAIEFFNLGEN
ncbi:MAG: TatD family hydrolase [Candidatus Zapsychrus exili]|nr:TatD family hydrolase [Candidatus Zapsychrus exili]